MKQNRCHLQKAIAQIALVAVLSFAIVLTHQTGFADTQKEDPSSAVSARPEESVPARYKAAFAILARGVDRGRSGMEEQRRGFDMLYELAESFPDNVDALFLGGNLPLGDKRTGEDESARIAIEKYTRVISLKSAHAQAHVNRAAFRFLQAEPTAGDLRRLALTGELPSERPANKALLENGLEDLDKAIELQPRMFSAHYNRGLVLKAMGRYDEAIEAFSKAIEIGLKNPSWKGHVPTFQEEKNTEVIAGAVPVCLNSGFLKYIVDNCSTLYAGRHRAVCQHQSLTYFASKNDPVAFAHYMIASCLAGGQKYKKALHHYNKAIKLNPRIGRFYQMRALSYVGTGDERRAQRDLDRHMGISKELIEIIMQQ